MSFKQDAQDFVKENFGSLGVDVSAGYNKASSNSPEVMTATRFNKENDMSGIADALKGITGVAAENVSVQSTENAVDRSDDIQR